MVNGVLSLDQLFHNRVFRVPDYQRGFAWETQQIEEFLEDLEILERGRYHYTGTVVLHDAGNKHPRMDSDGNTYSAVDIVDGQQRIATIVLLLDAIRRSLTKLSVNAKTLAHVVGKNYIAATENNGQPLYKLSLNTDCDNFFKNSVLEDLPSIEGPKITSERRLAEAKNKITDYMETKTKEAADPRDQELWLRGLYEKVVTQLRFSLYEVDTTADVGVIFEVMNNRGKQLSELEKVKNFLLYAGASLHVENDLSTAVNGAWTEILRQLMAADLVGSEAENRLLRAHWLTQYDYLARKWNGSKSIKERFDFRKFRVQHPALLDQLHEYVKGLRAACISVCDAYRPERTDAFASYSASPKLRSQVISWSAKLTRIGVVATFLPLLVATRQRWPNSPGKYLEILQLCEKYAFRVYRLKRARADAGRSTMYHAGYRLFHGEASFEEVCQNIKRSLRSRCNDDTFADIWRDDSGNWYEWRGLKYFLYEYEFHLASEKGASPLIEWTEIQDQDLKDTIEHVLPRTIKGVSYWRDRFDRSAHSKHLHRLGNLSLTKHNSNYNNKPFPEKKGSSGEKSPCYATSPFYMERELAISEEWVADAIDERRRRLVCWATNRWAVDWSGVGNEDEAAMVDGDVMGNDELPLDEEE